MDTPSTLLMVKPQHFGYNPETAKTNTFQKELKPNGISLSDLAIQEYDSAVKKIRETGIEVLSFEGNQKEIIPDAIFPNNWVGFHPNKMAILYPMTHHNRRLERNSEVLDFVKNSGHVFNELIDLSGYEKENLFLEGTGSMVFDYKNKRVYGCISPRTSLKLFTKVAGLLNVKPISFTASDTKGNLIYHTNVILTITEKLAIICLDCIGNELERVSIIDELKNSNLEIISISQNQVTQFAGNLFEVKNPSGKSYLIGSETAWDAFTKHQLETIKSFHHPLKLSIPTIETVGGGSARCMLAGVYY